MNREYRKSDFGFELPECLIAQHPLADRSSSRMLVLTGQTCTDAHFSELPKWLKPGDCLVLNNTRVMAARLIGQRCNDGAVIELLLLTDKGDDVYECLVKPGKKCRIGAEFMFGDQLHAQVIEVLETGNRLVKFSYQGVFLELLDKLGEMPLPPYIHEKLTEPERYQTVYAKNIGSAAAPTAGLHFTPELLETLRQNQVKLVEVTLHVGLGTFRPVKEEKINDHHMHAEYYQITEDACAEIEQTRQNGGRIIAVGTTSCRVLESAVDSDGKLVPQCGETNIFITPGYRFRVIDGLITNFHLPESTLMMLVSALYGRLKILEAYAHAIKQSYRFFSFGDAMLILPERKEIHND